MAVIDHPTSLAARAVAAADPSDRLRAIATLRDELDELETDAVRGAVGAGSSWSQVAEALGISKQSAHRRHAKKLAAAAPQPRPRPFVEEARPRIAVTPQAGAAVRAARAAARALNHSEVDTGHLLLGLMADPRSATAVALEAVGVRLDAAREAVARLGLPATPADATERTQVRLGYTARGALEQSLREAQRLGHEHLGVEHLLLALLRDEKGGAVRALTDAGTSAADRERCLGKLLMGSSFSPR